MELIFLCLVFLLLFIVVTAIIIEFGKKKYNNGYKDGYNKGWYRK